MDDMRAIMQDELRQAVAGLMPPPAAAPAPTAAILHAIVAHVATNSPIVDAPPANSNNAGGPTFECC